MSQTPIRRAAVVAASAALVATGLTTSVGAGVAGAETCPQSANATKSAALNKIYSYDRRVTAKQVAAGTEVTYETIVSTNRGVPYLHSVTEYPPEGFGPPVEATVTRRVGVSGLETDPFQAQPQNPGYKVAGSWSINDAHPVTVRMTYLVPEDIPVGTEVTSGGIKTSGTLNIGNDLTDALNVCFTVRGANPGEVVTGSLEDGGLGSSDGQLSSTDSVSDILGDTLTRFFENLS